MNNNAPNQHSPYACPNIQPFNQKKKKPTETKAKHSNFPTSNWNNSFITRNRHKRSTWKKKQGGTNRVKKSTKRWRAVKGPLGMEVIEFWGELNGTKNGVFPWGGIINGGGRGGREGGSCAQRERRKLVGNELNYYTSPSHLEFIFKKYNRSRYSNKKFIYTITIYFLTFR